MREFLRAKECLTPNRHDDSKENCGWIVEEIRDSGVEAALTQLYVGASSITLRAQSEVTNASFIADVVPERKLEKFTFFVR